MGIKIQEHWQMFKVYVMLLERYLGKRKIELLKKKIESAIGIQLKLVPQWLISKNYYRKQ